MSVYEAMEEKENLVKEIEKLEKEIKEGNSSAIVLWKEKKERLMAIEGIIAEGERCLEGVAKKIEVLEEKKKELEKKGEWKKVEILKETIEEMKKKTEEDCYSAKYLVEPGRYEIKAPDELEVFSQAMEGRITEDELKEASLIVSMKSELKPVKKIESEEDFLKFVKWKVQEVLKNEREEEKLLDLSGEFAKQLVNLSEKKSVDMEKVDVVVKNIQLKKNVIVVFDSSVENVSNASFLLRKGNREIKFGLKNGIPFLNDGKEVRCNDLEYNGGVLYSGGKEISVYPSELPEGKTKIENGWYIVERTKSGKLLFFFDVKWKERDFISVDGKEKKEERPWWLFLVTSGK